uniref:CCHC-type domain-containing protein n=1 Tax=Fopius arisanus TaxID=64838 RepID=A0A0C9QTS1_9HYME
MENPNVSLPMEEADLQVQEHQIAGEGDLIDLGGDLFFPEAPLTPLTPNEEMLVMDVEDEGPLDDLEGLKESLQEMPPRETATPDSGRGSAPPPPAVPSPALYVGPFAEIDALLSPAERLWPGLTARVQQAVQRLVPPKPVLTTSATQTERPPVEKSWLNVVRVPTRPQKIPSSRVKGKASEHASTSSEKKLNPHLQPDISRVGVIPRLSREIPPPLTPPRPDAKALKSQRRRERRRKLAEVATRPGSTRSDQALSYAQVAGTAPVKPQSSASGATQVATTTALSGSQPTGSPPSLAPSADQPTSSTRSPALATPAQVQQRPTGGVAAPGRISQRFCFYCRTANHAYRSCEKYLNDLEYYGGKLPPHLEFCFECGRRGRTLKSCPNCRDKWLARGPYMPSVGTNVPRHQLPNRAPTDTPASANLVASITAAVLAQLGQGAPERLGEYPNAHDVPGPSRRRRRGRRSGRKSAE